jgi:hypothetical protein
MDQQTNLQRNFNYYLKQLDSFNEHIAQKMERIDRYELSKGSERVLKAMETDLNLCIKYRDTTKALIESLLFEFKTGNSTTEKIISLEGRVGDFWKAFDAFGIPRSRVAETLRGIRYSK